MPKPLVGTYNIIIWFGKPKASFFGEKSCGKSTTDSLIGKTLQEMIVTQIFNKYNKISKTLEFISDLILKVKIKFLLLSIFNINDSFILCLDLISV